MLWNLNFLCVQFTLIFKVIPLLFVMYVRMLRFLNHPKAFPIVLWKDQSVSKQKNASRLRWTFTVSAKLTWIRTWSFVRYVNMRYLRGHADCHATWVEHVTPRLARESCLHDFFTCSNQTVINVSTFCHFSIYMCKNESKCLDFLLW